MHLTRYCAKVPRFLIVFVAAFAIAPAEAQEIRYSYLDMSYMAQDVDRQGAQVPIPGQSVAVDARDGDGVRFRGSLGTWNNLYLFLDFRSTDNDVSAVVTNAQGVFNAEDEYDFTAFRTGVGLKYSFNTTFDVFAELSYDSMDFDFGSFAGEDFDADDQDVGVTIGIRSMFTDEIELRAHARYTGVGDIDASTGEFDSDTLFSVGFGYELIRGLSITGDYESGEFSNWNIGFRLDLDED